VKHPPLHIFEFTPETLREFFASRGVQGFKASQVLEWVYRKGVGDPALMTNLSKRERELLAGEVTFLSGRTVREQAASDGTKKLLIEWDDAERAGEASAASLPVLGSGDTSRQTECVMIPAGEWSGGDEPDDGASPARARRTACISSQVGCPVGCRFCASGIGGLDGNLSSGRIVEQVWRLGRVVEAGEPGPRPSDWRPITNVVFMGMGEPLSNFQAVKRAVQTLAAPWGMGISARKITISTVGLPKAIERLAAELDLPVTLALSLHAPNDALRRELIPWAEYTTIPDLLDACQKWFGKTGREITLEYILLGGVNDRPTHARELASVAKTLRANVNLIRYNEVRGMPFSRPVDADVLEFQRILRDARVNVHIRASRGRDIAAACGQLRHEASSTPSAPASAAKGAPQ
jgi:23S rRNA (adenine2503-C2)-methyltransferase